MNPELLHLFNQGKEIAIRVNSETTAQFEPGDFIEFYATGIDNLFTDTNVYWLYWRRKGFGKRMEPIDGEVTGFGEKLNAFYEHLKIERDSQFWLKTPGAPDQDYWFWHRLNASDVKEYTFDIPSPVVIPSSEATIRVGFQGRTTAPPLPNHHTLIKLNGTVIGDEFWDGESTHIQEMKISSEISEGKNTLTIEMPGDTGAIVDVIYLNWIEIDYWRLFDAVNDSLVFTVNGNGNIQVTVKKFSQSDIVIYDITNLDDVVEVVNFSVEGEKLDYQATFETSVIGEKTYYVSTIQSIKSPKSLAPWEPAKLKTPKNGADYILITDEAFLPAVQPLGELRRRQGLRVKMISVQDIYNEFNDGLIDPAVIKYFLRYAYENRIRPAPTYVFLVGDASLKSWDTVKNKVPTHFSASSDGLTPDDNWYVSVDGDDDDVLPDMFIGRIPSDSPETATALVDKIIRFEESASSNPHKVLLVADNDSEFDELNELLFDFLPTSFNADKIYLRDYLTGVTQEEKAEKIAEATQDIIASFNDGVMISNYIGHGVTDKWSLSKGLFNPDHVHSLSNDEQLVFALMLTCINGYFVDPGRDSLAEEFLLAHGGAIGAIAPSNVSYLWEDRIMGREIFSSIFEQGNRVLGAITTQAKIAAYEHGASQSVLQMFTLFGDPAVSLKEWE
jgi:ASC-1-like (ASCH) protein